VKELAVAALVLAAGCATAGEPPRAPLGEPPSYPITLSAPVPNGAAIVRTIWVPELGEGFVPQGLAVVGSDVLLAAYRDDPLHTYPSRCRIYRIAMASGEREGRVDMPAACGHAGGLAYLGDGSLVVADTHRLWRIDLDKAFAAGRAEAALLGTVNLGGELRGSFAAFDGKDLWIGTWSRDPARSRMYRLDPRIFEEADGATVDEGRALGSIPVPARAQGAAFDAQGTLWVSTSDPVSGAIHRIDRATGNALASYRMVSGIEDLAFDGSGHLWAVSEAGARKYLTWSTHFPLVFEVDVAKLAIGLPSAQ